MGPVTNTAPENPEEELFDAQTVSSITAIPTGTKKELDAQLEMFSSG